MDDSSAINFATMVFDLLDRASTTSTYKYAVFLALLDCVQAGVSESGAAPTSVTTRQLTEKVINIYWNHARPFQLTGETLRQNSGGQASIINRILEFRERHAYATSVFRAQTSHPDEFTRLMNDVEWTLIEMPLPRLQVIGGQLQPFIYDIAWSTDVRKGRDGISQYQKRFTKDDAKPSEFDNRILLKANVGEHLVRLGPLLRPLIQREWTNTVAAFNQLATKQLEDFLFAPQRQALTALVEPLRDAQEGVCFYCRERLSSPEVDHFIPWSRSPNDGLHNFVLAHKTCNGSKSNHLADVIHLERWMNRNDPHHEIGSRFANITAHMEWLRNRGESVSIARATYLSIPEGLPLWLSKSHWSNASQVEIGNVFELGGK